MKIAFDTKLRRPACVILQAVMGGDPYVGNRFPSETWLLFPTPDMKVYEATDTQIDQLIEMSKKAVAGKKGKR